MIKHDYGHLGCPFYEENLDNKVKLVLLHNDVKINSALVYIAQGGYIHSKEDEKSLPGSAYFLMNLIASSSFNEELEKESVLLTPELDYSYVCYQLSSLREIYSSLKKLLYRIYHASYNENDVEALRTEEKRKWIERKQDPLYLSQSQCLENLYFSSPLKNGCIPSEEQALKIHASTLKKYQENYYTSDRITIFLSTGDDVYTALEKIKAMKLPSTISSVDKVIYQEDYKNVKKNYSSFASGMSHSYLTYGIKMPLRQNIYDKYGQLPFGSYEILADSLFWKNDGFIDYLNSLHARLMDVRLLQGGEDMAILLSFQGEDEVALTEFLTRYFSNLSRNIKDSGLKKVQHNYFANAMKTIANPIKFVKALAVASANHISYPELVNYVSQIKLSSYQQFLKEFARFKKSVCYVKRGK